MAEQLTDSDSYVTQENLDDLRTSCEFSKKTWREDMTLVVEGRQLFVSSSILALISPVFLAKMEETFKEGTPKELVLDGKCFDDIVEFLRCVYPNIFKPMSLQNVFQVLPLAAEYQAQALVERCEKFLIGATSEHSSSETLCKHLNQAGEFGLKDLTKHCLQFADRLPVKAWRDAEKKYPIAAEISLGIREKVIDNLNKEISTLNSKVKNLQSEVYYLK